MSLNSEFEEFWRAYPKRSGVRDRHAARNVFAGLILSGIDPKRIIHGAACYRNSLPAHFDAQFISMPVNWLNRRGWDDYDPPMSEDRFAQLMAKYRQKEAEKW